MTIKQLLHWAHEILTPVSESARLDAELLLCYVLKKPSTFLVTHDDEAVGFWKLQKYRRLIRRRKRGLPVAYLTGTKEFFGLDFEVNRHVLVPRPDTETLVECVVEYLGPCLRRGDNSLLLDVGTGSACIPISILKSIPDLSAIATEISASAIRVARRNIKKHELGDRIQLIQSNLLAKVPSEVFKDKELIVTANLPYIPTQFQVDPSTKFEPGLALYGGHDGLDLYRRLMDQLIPLKPRAIFIECFDFQKAILVSHMSDYRLIYAKNMTGKAQVLYFELIVD